MSTDPPNIGSAESDGGTLSLSLAAAIARSATARIRSVDLDLTGHVVITEAATGAYAVTAAAAGAAGAEVFSLAVGNAYGSASDAIADVITLATELRVDPSAVNFVTSRESLPLHRATLITNSGVLRPIDAQFIEKLPSSAVIALMYEAWEARDMDIDYSVAGKRGIDVIGVNEHHPACGAFEFVGDLALYGMRLRRWPIRDTRILLVSDNLFANPIRSALEANGGTVILAPDLASVSQVQVDVVVVAVAPLTARTGRIKPTPLSRAVAKTGAYGCVQVWGDLDRSILEEAGIDVTPTQEPRLGHQGFPMNAAGFEATVRLQIGGIAAAVHGSAQPHSYLYGLSQRVDANSKGPT